MTLWISASLLSGIKKLIIPFYRLLPGERHSVLREVFYDEHRNSLQEEECED